VTLRDVAYFFVQSNWSVAGFVLLAAVTFTVLFKAMRSIRAVTDMFDTEPHDPNPTDTVQRRISAGELDRLRAERKKWSIRFYVVMAVMMTWLLLLVAAVHWLRSIGEL
jgi:hypothetical protein